MALRDHAARFWSLVDTSGGEDACWPWLGSTIQHDGRGTFAFEGRNTTAPRVALALAEGIEPPGRNTYACHRCDNPKCCNPAHLWWGSGADNMADASAKRRLPNNQVTHCPKGHPFSGKNLRIVKGKWRRCARCFW